MRSLPMIAREVRESAGLTQAEAGVKVGRCQRVVSDLETGRKSPVDTLDYINDLAPKVGRTDLLDEALLIWSGRPIVLPKIPAGFETDLRAIEQYVEIQHNEFESAFASIPFYERAEMHREHYQRAAAEQHDVVRAEAYKLQCICERGDIDMDELLRTNIRRPAVAV